MSVIEKAIRLVDELARSSDFLTLSALSDATGLPKSSAHRMLVELARAGLVRRQGSTYGMGPRNLLWGEATAASFDLRQAADQPMRRLRDTTGESVHLYIREGSARICIAAVEGRYELRRYVRLGEPLPLRAGAAGKLLLAFADSRIMEAEIRLARQDEAEGRYPNAPGSRLREELVRLRADPWATSFDERGNGVAAAAAAVRDVRGQLVAAIVVSGPSFRLTAEALFNLRPDMEACAHDVLQRGDAA
jgi:DNA-binding IclR family transcriptional regulator